MLGDWMYGNRMLQYILAGDNLLGCWDSQNITVHVGFMSCSDVGSLGVGIGYNLIRTFEYVC